MMRIDAKGLHFSELNRAVRDSADSSVRIDNCCGHRYIASGDSGKTITINGVINDIQNVEIVEENSEFVDVYTIDGVLLKRNVKASEATDNLSKGIYIVGKKKVLVK